MISTREIKMSGKKMFSVLLMQNGILWFCIAILGVIIFSFLGIVFDYRFFVVALIWIFLILPMIVAFLYFYYGMRPLTAFNLIPHLVEFQDDELKIKFFEREENSEDGTQSSLMLTDSRKDYHIEKKKFTELKTGSDYIILFFGKEGWLWIPMQGVDGKDNFLKIVDSFLKDKMIA